MAAPQGAAAGQRVVLVAIDASENARAAVNYYVTEIHRKNDIVVLCHIPELADLPTFSLKAGLSLPVEEWTAAVQEQQKKMRELELIYENMLGPLKIQYKTHSEPCKTPGQGIITVAEAEKATLIVIGTRGLDRLRRTFLGSVSDYVVRNSRVPVLVCPLADSPTAN